MLHMNISDKKKKRAIVTEKDLRWEAVQSRDRNQDGKFYYGVITTGVYCRPSCAGRAPKPENVRFYTGRNDAEKAGFRACKRCKPDMPDLYDLEKRRSDLVANICRYIEDADEMPQLNDLAIKAGLSTYHFHRIFKSVTGLTPKQYATAHRAKRIRRKLESSDTVTNAIYDAGFNSNSRFYDKSNEVLGMTPTDYRGGGENTEIRFAVGECSLGSVLVAQSHRGVCAVLLGDDPEKLVRDLQDKFPRANFIGGDRNFENVVSKVVGFIESPNKGLDLPLDIRGTAFQQRVWEALREIPVGSTVSYAEVAKRIGSPNSYRAVAMACSENSLAVVIPCHRVIRNNGDLSGYRWGIERKRIILERERQK